MDIWSDIMADENKDTQDSENKVELSIEVEPELKQKIDALKETYGVTDEEILTLGIFEILKDIPKEELFQRIPIETYEKIINECEGLLQKIKEKQQTGKR